MANKVSISGIGRDVIAKFIIDEHFNDGCNVCHFKDHGGRVLVTKKATRCRVANSSGKIMQLKLIVGRTDETGFCIYTKNIESQGIVQVYIKPSGGSMIPKAAVFPTPQMAKWFKSALYNAMEDLRDGVIE